MSGSINKRSFNKANSGIRFVLLVRRLLLLFERGTNKCRQFSYALGFTLAHKVTLLHFSFFGKCCHAKYQSFVTNYKNILPLIFLVYTNIIILQASWSTIPNTLYGKWYLNPILRKIKTLSAPVPFLLTSLTLALKVKVVRKKYPRGTASMLCSLILSEPAIQAKVPS